MHELRKDPLLSRWIAVLGTSLPPEHYQPEPLAAEESGHCRLCAESRGKRLRIIAGNALNGDAELGRKGNGMYDRMNPAGRHELIIEASEHAPASGGQPTLFRGLLDIYQKRMSELNCDPKIRYVFIYKNGGRAAGAMSEHPHSSLLATPVIPAVIKQELDGAKQYFAYKERCIFCDIINEEQKTGQRIIAETERFIAFCPYSPRLPFEFWIMPKRHSCAFEEATGQEIEELASLMPGLIEKMRRALGDPPYNYYIHTAPSRVPRRNHWHTLGDDFHWHIEVLPRLSREGALDLGSGFYVLTTSPEDAAKFLKEA